MRCSRSSSMGKLISTSRSFALLAISPAPILIQTIEESVLQNSTGARSACQLAYFKDEHRYFIHIFLGSTMVASPNCPWFFLPSWSPIGCHARIFVRAVGPLIRGVPGWRTRHCDLFNLPLRAGSAASRIEPLRLIDPESQDGLRGNADFLAASDHLNRAARRRARDRPDRRSFSTAAQSPEQRSQQRAAADHLTGPAIRADSAGALPLHVGNVQPVARAVHFHVFQIEQKLGISEGPSARCPAYHQLSPRASRNNDASRFIDDVAVDRGAVGLIGIRIARIDVLIYANGEDRK